MVKRLIVPENIDASTLIYCPHSGEQVVGQGWQEFTIPNGRVIWWKCTACQGWHTLIDIIVEDETSDSSTPGTPR